MYRMGSLFCSTHYGTDSTAEVSAADLLINNAYEPKVTFTLKSDKKDCSINCAGMSERLASDCKRPEQSVADWERLTKRIQARATTVSPRAEKFRTAAVSFHTSSKGANHKMSLSLPRHPDRKEASLRRSQSPSLTVPTHPAHFRQESSSLISTSSTITSVETGVAGLACPRSWTRQGGSMLLTRSHRRTLRTRLALTKLHRKPSAIGGSDSSLKTTKMAASVA